MNTHEISCADFNLKISLNIFKEDIKYPSNTIMSVYVNNNKFAGYTEMDIDIKNFARFSGDLNKLYETLKGSAKIKEPYGQKQYIEFSGDGTGYISVSGFISFSENDLRFNASIDQTYIRSFAKELSAKYGNIKCPK